MIVKKVKYEPTDRPKPKAWQIGDLVDYIRQPHNVNTEEKIEHSGSRNFFAKTHAGQRGEMIGLASESAHSKMPVSHWIFSWQENEQPTAAQVDVFLEHMGLTNHQTIYGLHWNTENYHVHIAVNRMNPESMKVLRPHEGYDIEEAHNPARGALPPCTPTKAVRFLHFRVRIRASSAPKLRQERPSSFCHGSRPFIPKALGKAKRLGGGPAGSGESFSPEAWGASFTSECPRRSGENGSRSERQKTREKIESIRVYGCGWPALQVLLDGNIAACGI